MREAIRADEGGHQSQSVALEGRTRCSDDAAAVRVLSVRCRLPTTMRRARRGERRRRSSASDSWPPRTPPRTRRWEMTAARPGPWAGRALSAAATQQQGLGTEQDRSCPPRWLGLRKLAALTKPQRREGGTRRAFLQKSKPFTGKVFLSQGSAFHRQYTGREISEKSCARS